MSDAKPQDILRLLPQIDEVLRIPLVEQIAKTIPRDVAVGYVRDVIGNLRTEILDGTVKQVEIDQIVSMVCLHILTLQKPSLRRVINTSGVIIHTNLGRSVLAPEAVEAVIQVATGYSTLEYDMQNMARGSRHDHCEKLLCTLTKAEAAIAVNNNAAAVMMVLSEFAADHEAIVSRGELVEIGGSFRVPDIMEQSHATMVEVGTTNKTHLSDYEKALSNNTAMLLKVHPSNYRMIGFTESVEIRDLRQLAEHENERRSQQGIQSEVLVYEDQGSGALIKLDCFGEYHEPTVNESLEQGCDLVSFSGDKLLGGPQAGIIVGKKCYIDRLKKNPLARALRLDKMTLAALTATLRLYLVENEALEKIPTLRMLSAPASAIEKDAGDLLDRLKSSIDEKDACFTIVNEIARAGGGALPMCDIESYAVCVEFKRGSAQKCEEYLVMERETPIIARIKQEKMLFDVRTIQGPPEIDEIVRALNDYFTLS